MCHHDMLDALPVPGAYSRKEAGGLKYREYIPESPVSEKPVMVLTDIYGCNNFYQSFATYLASTGRPVHLIDLFSDLGELEEVTREAAFKRRHLLRDRQVCDQLQDYIAMQGIGAVVGFCLGANYVLEMAKRNLPVNLVGYYPFPAGLPNQDELEKPLNYLASLEAPVTVLVGDSDDSAGRDNMARLAEIARTNRALDVHLYRGSGHGFLAHLDSDDAALRKNAVDSLAVCVAAL